MNDDPKVAYGCRCQFCQRATGTAFRSGMRYRKENYFLNDAELNTYIYTSPENGGSLNVDFCPACVTTVTITTDRFPEAQVMMRGTLDDPSCITVHMHMFADEGMKWVSFGEDDSVNGKHRLNSDGTPTTPLKV